MADNSKNLGKYLHKAKKENAKVAVVTPNPTPQEPFEKAYERNKEMWKRLNGQPNKKA